MFRCCIYLVCFAVSQLTYADSATPSRSITGDILNNKEAVQLSVIDTYLELHTGPGRGYPIFHVMEKGETVFVHSRRTNWFYVSDRRNRQGWVKQEGLARTIAPTGMPAALPNIRHGDFLAQQGRVGFSLGQQGNADTATVMAGYRLLSFAGIEAEYGQIFGDRLDGKTYGASLLIEPIKDWSFTPFISKGYGWQEWQEKEKQQVGTSNRFKNRYEYTGFGINYYIGYSFVVRAEYRKMYVSGDNDSLSNSAWRLGFSSFF
ncbi:MAG: hypothetical protein ACI8SR_002477 [Oceanicoccus sp.]|jgi:hypothetical protein